jgi:hypothetical protein
MYETTHFEHLIKLVTFMEIILSREIKISDLEFAQKIINNFVEQFSSIYSDASMLSGVHELLHLVECTKYFGPLNLINLFPYEELNRNCIGVIHGRDLMGEELIKMFSLILSLSSTVLEFDKNSELNDFIKKNMLFKTRNKKRLKEAKDQLVVKIISKSEILDHLIIMAAIQKKFGVIPEEIKVYKKIYLNGVIYTKLNTKLKTKYCDSCFTTIEGGFGNIEYFFNYNDKFFVAAKKIVRLYNPFYWNEVPNIKHL